MVRLAGDTATRERLLAAAGRLFARHGYRRTSVTHIAEAAHVVKGAFYHYFANKDDILEAVIAAELEQVWKATREAIELADGAERKLDAFFTAGIGEARKRANAYAVLSNEFEHLPVIERLRRSSMRTQREILLAILTEGVDTGEFRKTETGRIADALAMILGLVTLSNAVFEDTDRAFRRKLGALVSIICEGIRRK